MSTTTFTIWWTGAGVLVGVGMTAFSRHFVTTTSGASRAAWFMGALLTAGTFAGFAVRYGKEFDLLPFSVLAAVGIALSIIDFFEQRLPSTVTYCGFAVVVALQVTASAILDIRSPHLLLRALAGMAILSVFYLVIALTSRGGLGAGDVKLGALLGVALAWSGWSALIAATVLGWVAAAVVWLVIRAIRRTTRRRTMPMAPFLVLSALLTIGVPPR